jgi:phage/plasmid-like protein (TIGR03299 family)
MAHNLEEQDGKVAFALRGAPAWHNLANRIFSQDEKVSTATMLEEAKLNNWNVRLSDVADHIPNTWRNTSDNFYVIRDNPFDQGNDAAKWESAGSIKKGKVVFGSLDIPREIVLDPQGVNDKTKLYLIVWTSHDGSVAVQAAITPVRVVCQNTLNLAMKGAKQSFKIRHTQTAEGRIVQARQALGLTFAYADEFQKQAEELFKQSITDKQFSDLIRNLYPKPEEATKAALTRWENKVVVIDDLYHNSPTNTAIKGTAWGAFNALTERLDYYRSSKTGNSDSLMASASGFDPVLTAEKNKILKMVKSLA